ncbi:MAG TPA: choline kinase family protein [Methyloceanibacter sp.]|nr:choline kinase family protein [Methyloceanibacter sp.]
MNADFDDAGRGLERLGFYTQAEAEGVEIERLGGLTNRVFMVRGPRGRHVLRIPGKGTEAYINRRVEAVAARAAARAGVSPEVIAFSDDGLMLTVTIENAATMTPESLNANPAAVARAGVALRKLHESGEKFDFRFELFSMIDDYLKLLKTKNASVPDGYPQAFAAAESVRRALKAHDLPLVPCHCDPVSENFLDTGEKMWIVDWEYSGMNDPVWDVGDFAVEAQLTPENEKALRDAYFAGTPTPGELGRYVIYKAMCDLLWTLWGLIQHADGNPVEDFWAYANRRFARCKKLMDSPEFPMHVENVQRGEAQ